MVSLGSCIHTLILSPASNEFSRRYEQRSNCRWKKEIAVKNWNKLIAYFAEYAAISVLPGSEEQQRFERTVKVMQDNFGYALFRHVRSKEGRQDVITQLFGGEEYCKGIKVINAKFDFDKQNSYVVKQLGAEGPDDWQFSIKVNGLGKAVLQNIQIRKKDQNDPKFRKGLYEDFECCRAIIFRSNNICKEKYKGWWVLWNDDEDASKLLMSRRINYDIQPIAWLLKLAKEKSEDQINRIQTLFSTVLLIRSKQTLADPSGIPIVSRIVMEYLGLNSYWHRPEREGDLDLEIPEIIQVEQSQLTEVPKSILEEYFTPQDMLTVPLQMTAEPASVTITNKIMGYLGGFWSVDEQSTPPKEPDAATQISEEERATMMTDWSSRFGSDNFL